MFTHNDFTDKPKYKATNLEGHTNLTRHTKPTVKRRREDLQVVMFTATVPYT